LQIFATQYEISQKKVKKKKKSEIFRDFFFIFFGDRGSAANLGYACKNLGRVVNPKLKFIFRS
jgi:hypothetical protein